MLVRAFVRRTATQGRPRRHTQPVASLENVHGRRCVDGILLVLTLRPGATGWGKNERSQTIFERVAAMHEATNVKLGFLNFEQVRTCMPVGSRKDAPACAFCRTKSARVSFGFRFEKDARETIS